jgi:hypothetical protein
VPTYTSTNTSGIIVKGPDGYYTIYPGDNELNFYLQTLPAGVTLTSHTPTVYPYEHLVDITSFPSADIAVYPYATIIISNKTDDICAFYANDDDENLMEIPAGGTITLDNKQEWGIITVSSAGNGTVTVWGCNE